MQEKIMLLTLELMKKEEKISQLMENIKGKQLLDILLCHIICLALKSEVVQLCDQNRSDDPRLSEKFEKVLASKQELSSNDKLTHEEPHDRVDNNDITSQSKI